MAWFENIDNFSVFGFLCQAHPQYILASGCENIDTFWPILEISQFRRFCNFLPFERIFRFSGNLFGISMSFFVKMADFLIPRVYTVFFENPAVLTFFRLTRKVFWSFWVPFSGSPAYYFGLCG